MDKNKLQEFCQKHKNDLPDYDTNRIGGTDHQPIFKSSVTICHEGLKHTKYGNPKPTAKKAELSAAKEMLTYVENIVNDNIKEFETDVKTYILIDMENIHMGDFFDKYRFNDNYYFIGFSTENHPSIKKASSKITIQTIKSDRRDACDILMIGMTAQLLTVNKNIKNIIILTGDHFGPGLVDFINNFEAYDSIKSKSVKTVGELVKYFQEA